MAAQVVTAEEFEEIFPDLVGSSTMILKDRKPKV